MMTSDPGWVTNDPEVARRLRQADAHYHHARAAAANFPLADKVATYRRAEECRRIAYDVIRAEFGGGEA